MLNNKYITKTIIDFKNPFYRCGGYNGTSGKNMRDNEYVHFTPEETAFGNYLYAIEILAGDAMKRDPEGYPLVDHLYVQGRIDATIELLDSIALSYIDSKNLTATFDAEKTPFKGQYANVTYLMPYVILYVALKNGFTFVDNKSLTRNGGTMLMDEGIVPCQPTTDLDMIGSISMKCGKEPSFYLSGQADYTK